MQAFKSYGQPLNIVYSFRYLVQTLTAVGDDFPEVVINLWKFWKVWDRMLPILGREGV